MPFTKILKITKKKIPLHVFMFEGFFDKKDFDEFKKQFDECLSGERFGAVFDMSKVTGAQKDLVLEQAKYMGEYAKDAKIKIIATSIVVTSDLITTILKVLFSIRKPTASNLITNTFAEALEFVEDNITLDDKKVRKG